MDAEAGAEPRVEEQASEPPATPAVAEGWSESPGIPARPRIDRASQTQQIPPEYFLRRNKQADFKLKSRHFWTGLGIWGVGFVLAFALSWKTNTNWNRGVFAKLSYGIGAGVHSWSYLLLWLMYIWGRHDPAAFVAKVATVTPVDVVS